MAVAGDIIIKLAADFAEFSKGMSESAKQLETFMGKTLDINKKIEGFVGELRTLARATGAAFVIDKVVEYTNKVQQMSVEVANLAEKYKLSTREVQALQTIAARTGQPMEKLVEYAKSHRDWLEASTLQAERLGLVIDDKVVKSMKQMNDEAAEAARRFDVMFSKGVAEGKSFLVEMLDRAVADLQAVAQHEGVIDKLVALAQMLTFSRQSGGAFAAGQPQAALENAERDLAALERLRETARQQAEARGIMGGPQDNGELAAARQRVEDARIAAAQARDKARAAAYGGTITPWVVPGDPIKTGGGGRSDEETIDALIARYTKMKTIADQAAASVRRNTTDDIADVAMMVEAKQAAADLVAKIAQTKVILPGQEKALEQAIYLSKLAQAEQTRGLKSAAEADATQRRLGDGTEAYADALQNLNRQLATGRLALPAYNRALKQIEETTSDAALQAKRLDNDVGSLVAGYQLAGAQYARSNDMFSQGGQLFAATTNVMGEGLDVLLGKSNKTFTQIAADFAMMLTKMALQAAVSQVFKVVFGGGSDPLAKLSTDDQIRIFSSYSSGTTPRAGGGDVYGGQSYWVGEYGPERFVPRAAGRIEPAGGGDMYVSIANYTDSSVTTKKSKGPGGRMQLDVVVAAVESKMAARLSLGQGSLGKTMEGKYGLQQAGR